MQVCRYWALRDPCDNDWVSCAPQLQEQKERLQAYMFEDQQKAAAQSQQQINALHDQLQKYASCIASQKQTVSLSLLPARPPGP